LQDSPDLQRNVLQVERVTKRYGKFIALSDISIELGRGQHLLVLGPNGAGKTTLIKCIMDLVTFNGTVRVDGINVKRDSSLAKTRIGYVAQNYAFYEGISVHDHAILSARLKGVNRGQAEEKLKEVDLWRFKDRKVRALSDGMKQRLGIAIALIGDPVLLLLDEPTSNVDLRGQLEFQILLKGLLEKGKTMLTTTHLTGLGELASLVLILDRGHELARGPPGVLLKNMGVNDTLYLRVKTEDSNQVVEYMRGQGVKEFETKGEWITASVPSEIKMKVVRSLMLSGYDVDDMLIERSKIESEYLSLVGSGRTN
jgi:ABC-type multidrug transport system ATPase subunit